MTPGEIGQNDPGEPLGLQPHTLGGRAEKADFILTEIDKNLHAHTLMAIAGFGPGLVGWRHASGREEASWFQGY